MLKKYRLFIIVFIFMLTLFAFSNVRADSVSVRDSITIDNVELTNEYILSFKNIAIMRGFSQYGTPHYRYTILLSNSNEFVINNYLSGTQKYSNAYSIDNSTSITYDDFYYISMWNLDNLNNYTDTDFISADSGVRLDNGYYAYAECLYTDYNLYKYNDVVGTQDLERENTYPLHLSSVEGNTDFFKQPPQVQEIITTLAPIVEAAETEKTLAEILGILPIILAVIISLIGLRKAFRLLLRLLRQS